MSMITADSTLLTYFGELKEVTEIRDDKGNLLGIYTPQNCAATSKPDYTEVRKLFDPKELAQRKERSKDDPGRTLDQIMERLRAEGKRS